MCYLQCSGYGVSCCLLCPLPVWNMLICEVTSVLAVVGVSSVSTVLVMVCAVSWVSFVLLRAANFQYHLLCHFLGNYITQYIIFAINLAVATLQMYITGEQMDWKLRAGD